LGYAYLKPRPRHRKNNPEAMAVWHTQTPPFVRKVRQTHRRQPGPVGFRDKARFGQSGTLRRVWARRGSRPRAVKQTEDAWIYLFAAVNPGTGDSVALLAPAVNTFMMNQRLGMTSEHVGPGVHVGTGAGPGRLAPVEGSAGAQEHHPAADVAVLPGSQSNRAGVVLTAVPPSEQPRLL